MSRKLNMRQRFKAIVVSGAHSQLGKTAVAEDLLRRLSGFSALKVTVVRRSACPRRNDCSVCSEFDSDFNVVTDKKIISRKGTDTARLKEAGAKKVVWLKSTLKGLRPGLKSALSRLKDSRGIVIEGTSVLRHIKPDLTIYLNGKKGYLRKIAKEAFKKADIIINAGR